MREAIEARARNRASLLVLTTLLAVQREVPGVSLTPRHRTDYLCTAEGIVNPVPRPV